MAVTIRLMRFGKRHAPSYRVVAIDKRRKRDGSYIEKVGTYNPMRDPAVFELNEERMSYWTKNGAQLSEGVRKLLKKSTSPAKAPAKAEVKETVVEAKAPAAKPAKTAKKAKKA